MEEFRNYDIMFPELVYDVLDYFRAGNSIKEPKDKSVWDYCQNSRFNPLLQQGGSIQPATIYKICENLAKKNYLNRLREGGMLGMNANYIYISNNDALFLTKQPQFVFKLNCLAYGFRYIYNAYCKFVLPIVVKKDGDIHMGTCFKFHSGILTAKHCVQVDEVSIPGYTAAQLNKCRVLVSEDEKIDMAFIETNENSVLISDTAQVLDEVLVMGYPRVPQFFDFCTAERAAISSIPTKGAVASLADQYITREAGQLMLVTARIRGGNSGGPVIDSNGAVVGVAFSEPTAQGDYDEMGYGVAYPIRVFYQMLQNCTSMKVKFMDEVN
ncbi:MAG: trypsin-like peptidase domain-containing protein [Bacteroidaceae bacterium]|nr:trypsin-like peptidase domain-containing protein [Bacteroidaceae bacterium]